jgi:hypothetical protein
MASISYFRSMRSTVALLCTPAFVLALSSPAWAQEGDVAAAASAFNRAQEAEARGEMAKAADLYELADRLSPAPAALRSATRARLDAGQLASAAADAEELKRRYPTDAASVTLADEALAKSAEKLVRVAAECSADCSLVIDGLAASADSRRVHVVYLEPGVHTLVARFPDGSSASQHVEGAAKDRLDVKLVKSEQPAPAPASAPAPPVAPAAPSASATASSTDVRSPSGLSPVVGLVLGGVALGLGGVAVWSALDTKSARDDFDKNPTRTAFDEGQGKDVRTNILIGASAVVGAASLGVLVFATNWSGSGADKGTQASLHVFASPQGTAVGMRGSF